ERMFAPLTNSKTGHRLPWLTSLAIHGLALLVLLHRSAPRFLAPSSVVLGNHGHASLVYLAASSPQSPTSSVRKPLSYKPPVTQLRANRKTIEVMKESGPTVPAGSPYGSLATGAVNGYEARPALPIVFPDPIISRSDLPPGVQGDVIVEVTIDADGRITDTRVLASLGYGIDDKVVAVLRNWRFRPATVDGAAIPSRQDVHFHFPS
ncbi:MAG: TonB family protein, partial [Acidobacteriales bacterium]|nr:TonB family protein [Terriglobales bacterium]